MAEKNVAHESHMGIADNLGIKEKINRPVKVVFMGAGSAFFRNLFVDMMHISDEGEMALVDIDRERLGLAEKLGRKILDETKKNWKLTATAKRREVLEGADYIINCIEVSGVECVKYDNDIPMEYGVDQCIGDTIGPGGLFKGLRTVPVWLAVLKDVEELCPKAWILNYTNPMSIMCLAAARASKAKVMGLCHSVQGTSHKLAKYAEVPYSELDWDCAGINHLAWFTRLEHNGRDLYPLLKNKLEEDPELRSKDPVRLDIMKHLGYFVTESSGHFSEYLPYYRKRKELIDEYCGKRYLGESGFYARGWPTWRVENDNMRKKYIAGEEKLEIKRTWEYASYIIEAMETNSPFVAHVTMPNNGRITNLPDDGVVETATLMDRNGATPVHFGKLPPQCAALCDWNMRMFELAATACIERSKEAAVHALMLDPLTAAVCSPAEIREMTYRLFEAEKDFLPEYK